MAAQPSEDEGHEDGGLPHLDLRLTRDESCMCAGQVLVEAVRVPSRDGGVLERLRLEEPETGQQAAAQAGALGHVARFCVQLCPALLDTTEVSTGTNTRRRNA